MPSSKALTAFLLLALFVALYVPFLNQAREALDDGQRDFPSFYYATRAAFVEHRSPYDPAHLAALAGHRVFPFVYAPPSLLVLAPLSLLPYETSKVAFLAFNHLLVLAILGLTLFQLLRLRLVDHAAAVGFAVAYVLSFTPLSVQLSHGQVNLLLTLLMVVTWMSLKSARPASAGVALALAIALKTYPAILLPFLVVQRRWRELSWTGGALAALCLVSAMVLPSAAWSDWMREVMPAGGYGGFSGAETARALQWPGGAISAAGIENQSLNGVLTRLFTENKFQRPIAVMPGLAKALAYAVNAALVLLTLAASWWAWRRGARRVDEIMVLTLLLSYLVAPISWEHHLVYVLPAVIVLGIMLFDASGGVGWQMAVWFGSSVLLAAPFLLRFKVAGVLALWAMAIYATLAQRRDSVEAVASAGPRETLRESTEPSNRRRAIG